MKTPAELKSQQKETKSLVTSIFLASMMIGFALASTFFDFESLASRIVMVSSIIIASLLGLFILACWIKNLDEYEAAINARASMVALYSSLLYLPFQYLSEIDLLPEINIAFLFMFMWFIYLIYIIRHHYK